MISESTQTLADGNRIVHKSASFFARDGEGRTRREMGPGDHKMIIIDDPVAGVHYALDPREKTARKVTLKAPAGGAPAAGRRVEMDRHVIRITGDSSNAKTEQMGKSTMEGVAVTGTRTTLTIPAGEIGNERAMTTTSEQWISEELQAVISSKRSDPRMGESSMRVTNLRRSEPPRYLFEVPADYKIVEAGEMKFEHRVRRAPAPHL
jgi:hypothetical protein